MSQGPFQPKEPGLRLEARVERATRCPYCRENLRDLPSQSCGGCGVGYHQVCAAELSRCATVGCEGTLGHARVEPRCSECLGDLGDRPVRVCEGCALSYHRGCAVERVSCACGTRLTPEVVFRRAPGGREGTGGALAKVVLGAFGLAAVCAVAFGVPIYFLMNRSPSWIQSHQLFLTLLPIVLVIAMFSVPFAIWGKRE